MCLVCFVLSALHCWFCLCLIQSWILQPAWAHRHQVHLEKCIWRWDEIFSIETVLNQITANRIHFKIKELQVQMPYNMLEQIIEHDVVDSLAIVAAVVYSQIWGYCEFNNVSGTFRITLGTRLLTIELCTHQQQWTWVFLYFSSLTISGPLLFVCSYFDNHFQTKIKRCQVITKSIQIFLPNLYPVW